MASPKKAGPPRRPAAAGKEVVPDVPSARAVTSGPAPLQVVSPAPPPDPEVSERAARRRFTAEYKLRVLRQADAGAGPGEVGALLRREGLYSSHLASWRAARREGSLAQLSRKRGSKPTQSPESQEVERLGRENARLRRELEKARKVIEVQKKLSEILEVDLETPEKGSGGGSD